ncbi:MAG: FIST N-terminal domain-containing protein [Candidatus Competibacterales bacterium]
MRWASTVVEEKRLDAAVLKAGNALLEQLDFTSPDLLFAFATPLQTGGKQLHDLLPAPLRQAKLVGCSAAGVLGGGRELEQRSALALLAAVLPEVQVTACHLQASQPTGAFWQQHLGVSAADDPHFVVLADPFSFNVSPCLAHLDEAFPKATKVGGLASGDQQTGSHWLLCGDQVHHGGAVVLALTGNVTVDSVVAQGCRPIGDPLFVTKAENNVIHTLDGQPPVTVIKDLFEKLKTPDRKLMQHSLFLGLAMRRDDHVYRQGDFLIRNITGFDPNQGFMSVGAIVENNTVVQFHLRDAQTSKEDLDALLVRYGEGSPTPPVAGGLMFSCLGRGQFLYGNAHHDTQLFQRHLGNVPLGGFFCNGEIGPVQGRTYLHGYTSSFGLVRPKR